MAKAVVRMHSFFLMWTHLIFKMSIRGPGLKLAPIPTLFIIILSAVGTPVSLNGQTEGNYPQLDEPANEPLVNEGQKTELITETCDNSVDDDGDGLVDGDDEDCPAQARQPELKSKELIDTQPQEPTQTQKTESSSTTLQSYSNSKLGISLKHPTDWKPAYLKNGIQFIKEKNGLYLEIRKHNLESPLVDLKQYVGDDIKDRSSSREGFKLLNITQTTISGNLPAYKAIYTFLKTENQKDFATEGTTNKISRTWTFADGNAYLVAYVADEDNYGLYLPVVEKIIDTLKINPESLQSFSDSDSNDNAKNSDSNDNAKNSDSNDNAKNSDSNDNAKNSDSNDNAKNSDSKDGDDGGDKDCSDFDKKNFKVQPGDPFHLDRDGDGIACEG
jgi:hypothetical protein